MDRQLLERMIGAAVLVVVLILVVPAILTGPEQIPAPDTPPAGASGNLRQLTIRPDDDAPAPPVSRVAVAPKAAVTKREPAADSAPEKPAATPAGKAKTKAEPRPEAKPATQVADSSPKSSPAPKPKPRSDAEPVRQAAVADRETGWVVQLGSFASKPNAEGLASKVKAAGYQSYLVPLDRNGKTLYRVRVGPPDDQRSKAEQLAGKLARSGYRGQVTRQEAEG